MKKILLIEPEYKNKYPPLGLMKISSFHKKKGHKVYFYKGCSPELKNIIWDRIYISTLFTFYWNTTMKTIKFYLGSVNDLNDIYVGGVMASLLKDEIHKELHVTVVEGLLNKPGKLGYEDDGIVDAMVPDYTIIDKTKNPLLNYYYPTSDCYIAYATRGCIRKCDFCAVHKIEPEFSNSLSLVKQVNAIRKRFGEKKNLLLLDNNILASDNFKEIIDEIKFLGFEKDKNKFLGSYKRYVDFNQGIDVRLLTREKMQLLSEIAVKPLRIAFDRIQYKDIYIKKVRMAAEYGIKTLSNYILYNYDDKPEDFYERLKINVELNEEFRKKERMSEIWSFPMRYSPISGEYCKNRKFIGKWWNKKYLRAIQCILIPTHGIVGPKKDYFQRAFGRTAREFKKILLMPENYIINRNKNEIKSEELWRQIKSLTSTEKNRLLTFVSSGYKKDDCNNALVTSRLLHILRKYEFNKGAH